MNLIEHTTQWVKGEILQGKIMVLLAIIILFFVVKWGNINDVFSKGMMIPLLLLAIALTGYSTYQWTSRGNYLKNTIEIHQENSEKAFDKELQKAEKDKKAYAKIKIFWLCLAGLSVIGHLWAKSEFYQALNLGFIIFFVTCFVVDSILQHRLNVYYAGIKSLISK